jgi:hypothetical protein
VFTTALHRSEATTSAAAAPRRRSLRRLPVDLLLGSALLLVALLAHAFVDSPEVRDARPYLGTWTSGKEPDVHALVVETNHRATLDDVRATWRLVRPAPSRVPPPPSLEVVLPGGRTLRAHRQAEGLVTWDGTTYVHWERRP